MKYSKYYKKLMGVSFFTGLIGVISLTKDCPVITALLFTVSFIFWYAGIMAPRCEKYKQKNIFPARKTIGTFKKRKP